MFFTAEAQSPRMPFPFVSLGVWAVILCELLQKPNIALEEQLNIVHAILQQRDSVSAHAESKSRDLCGVITMVAYELEDIRVHHATTQQLDPSALLAGAAALAAAEDATDRYLSAWFRKRKE